MKFPRRDGRTLALAAGGAVVAASLFFTAQRIQAPIYSESGFVTPIALLSSERTPIALLPMPDSTFYGGSGKPDLGVGPVVALGEDALVPKEFPVGTDYDPHALPSVTPAGLEGAWAAGPRWDGDEYRWLGPMGSSGGYALVYAVAPPGPAELQRYGGDPNAPDTGARTYTGVGDGLNVMVPEPGVVALLSVGLVLVGIRRRRE